MWKHSTAIDLSQCKTVIISASKFMTILRRSQSYLISHDLNSSIIEAHVKNLKRTLHGVSLIIQKLGFNNPFSLAMLTVPKGLPAESVH
jgi:hypothetical protein